MSHVSKIIPKYYCNCYGMLAWKRAFSNSNSVHIENKLYYCGRCKKGFSPEDNIIIQNLIYTLSILNTFGIFKKDIITKQTLSAYNNIHGNEKKCFNCEINYTSLLHNDGSSFQNFENNRSHSSNNIATLLANKNLVSTHFANDYEKESKASVASLTNNTIFQSLMLGNKKPDCTRDDKISLSMNDSNSADMNLYPCTMCFKSFKQQSLLTAHHLIHIKETLIFSCSECNCRFRTKRKLLSHMRLHKHRKPYCCSICDRIFSYQNSLERHICGHYEEISKNSYSCKLCKNIFTSKTEVIRHLNEHAVENPCNMCRNQQSPQYVYRLRNGFVYFYCPHTGVKRFACRMCNKRFVRKNCLLSHACVHSGKKPFSCAL